MHASVERVMVGVVSVVALLSELVEGSTVHYNSTPYLLVQCCCLQCSHFIEFRVEVSSSFMDLLLHVRTSLRA
jgi:hypothetical protein